MGLELDHEINNSGVSAKYWRPIIVNMGEPDGVNPSAHIEVAGYVSEELRRAGKSPLIVIPIDVTGDDFATFFGAVSEIPAASPYDAIRAAAYQLIKTQRISDTLDFTQAVDLL